MRRDSILNTFRVALLLCLVCSLLVSAAAVGLRSKQKQNALQAKQKNILIAAGLYEPGMDVAEVYGARVDRRLVALRPLDDSELPCDLQPGDYVPEDCYPDTIQQPLNAYDQMKAAAADHLGADVEGKDDLAGIKRRENYSSVYVVKDESGNPMTMVLPIRGYGLWSTLKGFIAIDLSTLSKDNPEKLQVKGLTYYEHGETPGLGGEVDNPAWKDQWPGTHIYDNQWNVELDVVKDPKTDYDIDAISGATITSNGVSNMMAYWFGEQGFRPLLQRLAQ